LGHSAKSGRSLEGAVSGRSRLSYVLVNNRSAGNAPLAVQTLSEMLRD